MNDPQGVYDAFLLANMRSILTDLFNAGVEHVALSNGFPVESFRANDPPCRIQSALARGLEVVSLLDAAGLMRLGEAIVVMTNDLFTNGIADHKAQGFSELPFTRGQA